MLRSKIYSLMLLLSAALPMLGQSLPVINKNGQSLYEPDKPFHILNVVTLNGKLYADAAGIADINASINAAFASQNGKASALVELSPGNVYQSATPLVIPSGVATLLANGVTTPAIYTPELDCHGSKIQFTGTSDLEGVKILARNGGTNGSGSIRNCRFEFISSGSHLRWEGSTFFSFENNSVACSTAAICMDMVNVNSAAFGSAATGSYFEENRISLIETSPGAGGCFMGWRQDPTLQSNGSFFYNWIQFVHWGGNGSNIGICLQTSTSPNVGVVNAFGNMLTAHVNGGANGFIDLPDGTFFTRAVVNITGEANNSPAHIVVVHGPNALFMATSGTMSATGGWDFSFQSGAHVDQIRFPNANVNVGGDAFPEPGNIIGQYEVNPSNREIRGFLLSSGDHTLAALSTNEGYCNDYSPEGNWFRVQRRVTKFGYSVLENDPAIGGTDMTNMFDATGNDCTGVHFGAGFHDGPTKLTTAQLPDDLGSGPSDAAGHRINEISQVLVNGLKQQHGFHFDGSGNLTEYFKLPNATGTSSNTATRKVWDTSTGAFISETEQAVSGAINTSKPNTNLTLKTMTAAKVQTATVCAASGATPLACGSAAAGSVALAPSTSSTTVNTSAVTANSQILLFFDYSLGTRLGVTCAVITPAQYFVTARVPGVSFSFAIAGSSSNPACFSYLIVN